MTAVPVCSTKVLVRYEQSKGEYKIWSNTENCIRQSYCTVYNVHQPVTRAGNSSLILIKSYERL